MEGPPSSSMAEAHVPQQGEHIQEREARQSSEQQQHTSVEGAEASFPSTSEAQRPTGLLTSLPPDLLSTPHPDGLAPSSAVADPNRYAAVEHPVSDENGGHGSGLPFSVTLGVGTERQAQVPSSAGGRASLRGSEASPSPVDTVEVPIFAGVATASSPVGEVPPVDSVGVPTPAEKGFVHSAPPVEGLAPPIMNTSAAAAYAAYAPPIAPAPVASGAPNMQIQTDRQQSDIVVEVDKGRSVAPTAITNATVAVSANDFSSLLGSNREKSWFALSFTTASLALATLMAFLAAVDAQGHCRREASDIEEFLDDDDVVAGYDTSQEVDNDLVDKRQGCLRIFLYVVVPVVALNVACILIVAAVIMERRQRLWNLATILHLNNNNERGTESGTGTRFGTLDTHTIIQQQKQEKRQTLLLLEEDMRRCLLSLLLSIICFGLWSYEIVSLMLLPARLQWLYPSGSIRVVNDVGGVNDNANLYYLSWIAWTFATMLFFRFASLAYITHHRRVRLVEQLMHEEREERRSDGRPSFHLHYTPASRRSLQIPKEVSARKVSEEETASQVVSAKIAEQREQYLFERKKLQEEITMRMKENAILANKSSSNNNTANDIEEDAVSKDVLGRRLGSWIAILLATMIVLTSAVRIWINLMLAAVDADIFDHDVCAAILESGSLNNSGSGSGSGTGGGGSSSGSHAGSHNYVSSSSSGGGEGFYKKGLTMELCIRTKYCMWGGGITTLLAIMALSVHFWKARSQRRQEKIRRAAARSAAEAAIASKADAMLKAAAEYHKATKPPIPVQTPAHPLTRQKSGAIPDPEIQESASAISGVSVTQNVCWTMLSAVRLEFTVAAMLALFLGITAVFATGVNGPAQIVGNLYYATWISFLLTIRVGLDCLEEILHEEDEEEAAAEEAAEAAASLMTEMEAAASAINEERNRQNSVHSFPRNVVGVGKNYADGGNSLKGNSNRGTNSTVVSTSDKTGGNATTATAASRRKKEQDERQLRLRFWAAVATFSFVCAISAVDSALHTSHGVLNQAQKYMLTAPCVVTCIGSVMFLMCLNPIGYIFVQDFHVGGFVSIAVFLTWLSNLITTTHSPSSWAVNAIGDIRMANLYYFSWASTATSGLQMKSYVEKYFNIESTEIMSVLWFGLFKVAIVQFGAGMHIWHNVRDSCDDARSLSVYLSFCVRTKFAVAAGLMGTVIGILGTFWGMFVPASELRHLATFEFVLSVFLLLFFAIATVLITSHGGPGQGVGDLFYFSWLSFIVCILLVWCGYDKFKGEGEEADGDDAITVNNSSGGSSANSVIVCDSVDEMDNGNIREYRGGNTKQNNHHVGTRELEMSGESNADFVLMR